MNCYAQDGTRYWTVSVDGGGFNWQRIGTNFLHSWMVLVDNQASGPPIEYQGTVDVCIPAGADSVGFRIGNYPFPSGYYNTQATISVLWLSGPQRPVSPLVTTASLGSPSPWTESVVSGTLYDLLGVDSQQRCYRVGTGLTAWAVPNP